MFKTTSIKIENTPSKGNEIKNKVTYLPKVLSAGARNLVLGWFSQHFLHSSLLRRGVGAM